MRVVTFKLRDEELEELDRFAARLGMTRSDLIRRAIKRFMQNNGHLPLPRPKIRKVILTP